MPEIESQPTSFGEPPARPSGHDLLAGRTVVRHGRGRDGHRLATARRCVEEGARVAISDRHERRLAEAALSLAEVAGEPPRDPLRRD